MFTSLRAEAPPSTDPARPAVGRCVSSPQCCPMATSSSPGPGPGPPPRARPIAFLTRPEGGRALPRRARQLAASPQDDAGRGAARVGTSGQWAGRSTHAASAQRPGDRPEGHPRPGPRVGGSALARPRGSLDLDLRVAVSGTEGRTVRRSPSPSNSKGLGRACARILDEACRQPSGSSPGSAGSQLLLCQNSSASYSRAPSLSGSRKDYLQYRYSFSGIKSEHGAKNPWIKLALASGRPLWPNRAALYAQSA